jgi:hypothetical protein
MTVTNYQGEARAYLEKLVEACGAKFTRNMTTANTHLIAARSISLEFLAYNSKSGDKCKHAHDWGIDVVNHLWLEETYAKWQVQSVTIPRYTHFPPQTNLTEIVDKTEIQEEGILDFFTTKEDEDDEMIEINPMTSTKGKDVESSYVTSEKKTPAPSSSVRKISPSSKVTGMETPAPEPTRTPSSRKAAENASAKLRDEVMPDLLRWQKEKNRKRIPEEPQVSRVDEVEKKKKIEKRKAEDKENVGEVVSKKAKKDVESIKNVENKVTLLVTGAPEDLLSAHAVKVCNF